MTVTFKCISMLVLQNFVFLMRSWGIMFFYLFGIWWFLSSWLAWSASCTSRRLQTPRVVLARWHSGNRRRRFAVSWGQPGLQSCRNHISKTLKSKNKNSVYFSLLNFYCRSLGVLCVPCVYHVHVYCLWKLEEGMESLEIGVIDICEMS